jgi:hypothetical protein
MGRPIIIFDTSALNRLANDPDVNTLFAGIKTAYFVRITGTMIGELVATESSEHRRRLLAFERRLRSEGEVILPFADIIAESIKSFKMDAMAFDWRKIHIPFKVAEQHLARNPISDEIAAAQKAQAIQLEGAFLSWFKQMQVRFEALFQEQEGKRFGDSSDVLVHPQLNDMLAMHACVMAVRCGYGEEFSLAKGESIDVDERIVHQFYDACPPFRATLVALCILQYEYGIRNPRSAKSFRAGRVDTLMAPYLPYCNRFVSDDGKQLNMLKQVTEHAGLSDCLVLSYSEFRSSLIGLA